MLIVLLIISFVMSVFWIWLFANVLIDLLKTLGLLTGLPTTLLGLTVIAWGNSIGDLMANTSIARKGFVEMAVTGCVASPLFNILLGLGLSTLRNNILTGDRQAIRFTVSDEESIVPIILILGTFVDLVFTIIFTIFVNKYRITKTQAKIKIGIYALIMAIAVYKSAF